MSLKPSTQEKFRMFSDAIRVETDASIWKMFAEKDDFDPHKLFLPSPGRPFLKTMAKLSASQWKLIMLIWKFFFVFPSVFIGEQNEKTRKCFSVFSSDYRSLWLRRGNPFRDEQWEERINGQYICWWVLVFYSPRWSLLFCIKEKILSDLKWSAEAGDFWRISWEIQNEKNENLKLHFQFVSKRPDPKTGSDPFAASDCCEKSQI